MLMVDEGESTADSITIPYLQQEEYKVSAQVQPLFDTPYPGCTIMKQ